MVMLWNKVYVYVHSEVGCFSHERKQ